MQDLLMNYYGVSVTHTVRISGRDVLTDGEYIYLIIPSDNKEAIYLEQAVLSHFLFDQGWSSIARFMQNIHGEWFTLYKDRRYVVIYAVQSSPRNYRSPGYALAQFHQIGATYDYEPNHISSYGVWKQLWMNKLDLYEQIMDQVAAEDGSTYMNVLLDHLPYIVGMSENAIQYIQESEDELRMNDFDRGTIAFQRYTGQIDAGIIWPYELVYDHGTRDLAEIVRQYLLFDHQGEHRARQFLTDYQSIRPLSILAWRSLYARLLMPMHILDVIGEGFKVEDRTDISDQLTSLLENQTAYEEKLGRFFSEFGCAGRSFDLPVVNWL
ncbi:hypothetical protein [Lentibacillus saliphilus]|uniref:hypothetical protein n=1 Tax=Lentibacillus saliphilus TaxID=2737028 RepID=UPI001C2FD024|nr:hypothetical protein [Lentibacillus saliphilus]